MDIEVYGNLEVEGCMVVLTLFAEGSDEICCSLKRETMLIEPVNFLGQTGSV